MTKLFLALAILASATPALADDTKPVALAKAVIVFQKEATDQNSEALKAAYEANRCGPKSKAGLCVLVRHLFPKL